MATDTALTAEFADGAYEFWLPMPRVIAAEREMGDKSIFTLFHELGENLGMVDEEVVLAGPSAATLRDCHALIRNALIGGGQPEKDARELVETYCFPARAAIADMALAWKILEAAIYAVRLKPQKKSASESGKIASGEAMLSSTVKRSGSTGAKPRSGNTSKRSKAGLK